MRSFIALPIDPKTALYLEKVSQTLQQQPWADSVRWFPKENFHLTLQFIGSKVRNEKIEQIIRSMDDWFAEGMSFFEAEIRKIQLFPSPSQPHTIVASLDTTLLLQYLVREIEDHLKPIGLERSKQSFRPHISLGRIKTHADLSVIHLPDSFSHIENRWLTVDRLTLYKSQLTEQSPIYTPLKTIYLERYN